MAGWDGCQRGEEKLNGQNQDTGPVEAGLIPEKNSSPVGLTTILQDW